MTGAFPRGMRRMGLVGAVDVAAAGVLAGFEVGDDGEYSAVVVVGFGEVEFGEDMADVFFDGAFYRPRAAVGLRCARFGC